MSKIEISGVLLDESLEMKTEELCEACSMSSAWVVELVDEGVLEPVGSVSTEWRFSGASLARAQTARRLQRDLELNMAGIALALDLMDEIRSLRERIARRIDDEPGPGR